MIAKVAGKTTLIVLCLGVFLFCSSSAYAGAPSRASKQPKKKVEKSVNPGKTIIAKERSAIVNVPSSEVFSTNSQESERVTEVLLGDEFKVIREDKDWAYGSIPSQKDYHGWIKKANISSPPDNSLFTGKSIVQVRNALTRITFRDGSYMNVYAGTRLPLLNRDNRRYEVVALPDGTTGYLPLEAAWIESDGLAKEVTAKDILQASKFYGSGYKWGGITKGGMDCSGFVYTAFRLNGIYLKRDSYLQAEEGLDVLPEELQAGDLVFFKSGKANRIDHVGIYAGDGNFIHSSRGKKGVAVSSLSDEPFRNNFVGAKRVLTPHDDAVRTKQDKEQTPKPQNKNET